MRSSFYRLILVLIIAFLIVNCSRTKDANILRYAHGHDISHPIHKAAEFMAKRLREESKGKLTIKIYPNQQLGSQREALELLQIGSIDITKTSAAVLENFVPEIQVFSLPYLFRDDPHQYAVLDGEIGEQLLLAPEKYRMRGLTYYDAGFRSFYTEFKSIDKPGDLMGLKIRVQESVMAIALVNSLGASPTPISYGELYSALQQGIVDGAENNPPSFLSSRHYEICKFYSLNEHTAVPDILLIGTKSWDKLTDDEKKWLQKAVDASTKYQRELWTQAEDEALRKVKEAGVKITRPDKQPFTELTQPIYETLKKNNPELYSLSEKIREVKSLKNAQ